MRILTIDSLPFCFGLEMAKDLNNNEILRVKFEDANEVTRMIGELGIWELAAITPLVTKSWERVKDELLSELAKKRGEPATCGDCDVRGACFITALLLIEDESKWC